MSDETSSDCMLLSKKKDTKYTANSEEEDKQHQKEW